MTDDQAELRRQWRKHHEEHDARFAAWRADGYKYPPPAPMPLPEELRALTCGARTRAGTPCKRRDLYASGRCRLHGGLSTGPKGKPHEGLGKVRVKE